jgi:hypothetical protein
MMSLEFFIDIILPLHYGPGVDSAFNRNEYQEYFLERGQGKGGRCVGLTNVPPSCSDCLEILGASTSWNPHGLYRDCFTFMLDLAVISSHVIYPTSYTIMYLFFSNTNKLHPRTSKLRHLLSLSSYNNNNIIMIIISCSFHDRPLLLPLFLLYVSIFKDK